VSAVGDGTGQLYTATVQKHSCPHKKTESVSKRIINMNKDILSETIDMVTRKEGHCQVNHL